MPTHATIKWYLNAEAFNSLSHVGILFLVLAGIFSFIKLKFKQLSNINLLLHKN
jgi:hypothetical protein